MTGRTRTRVRVADLRPDDLLIGSSQTVVTTPGRNSAVRRRHVQLVIRNAEGKDRLVQWRADTMVYVLRPTPQPEPRRDIDG